ncbi:MAG: hypothetical protein HPY53_12900 [Brevinematales bacterium]|nr:hypothetical protein [Brevinematales bacterium]
MKSFKKIGVVFAALFTLILGACPPLLPPENNEPIPLKIKFDFSGTFNPEAYNAIPFILGDVNEVIMGAGDWDQADDAGGITASGIGGVQLLTKEADGTWSITLAPTNNNIAWGIAFKAANYYTELWSATTNDFWNSIGTQLTGVNNEQIFISNGMIIAVQKPGGTLSNVSGALVYDGFTVSGDQKSVTIDVGAHGGWSVSSLDGFTNDISVTIIWTNIPAWNHNPSKEWGWLPLLGLVSNTNTGATTAVIPTITGGAGFLHTNGVATWDPKQGNLVTLDPVLKTAYVTFTVPTGSARTFEFKMANTNGWDSGEEANNQAGILPIGGGVYTQIVNFSKAADYLP